MKKLLFPTFLVILVLIIAACNPQNDYLKAKWNEAEQIVKNLKAPQFPDKSFNIMEFGAENDSTFDSRDAIQKAIDKCTEVGGGTVIVPMGKYYSGGSIFLKNNTNLHFEEGTILYFSVNPADYLPVVLSRWEGVECYNYSALIYAVGKSNIAITGKGILHGKASSDNWWSWKGISKYGWQEGMPSQNDEAGRPTLLNMNNIDIDVTKRVFGDGAYLRPNFVQFINCQNVLIEGVTFKDSPMWILNPVLCENVIVRGVTLMGFGPNNDGCDPESCKNVLIEDCFFNTGDDCIAIKSGRNNDGRRINVPAENIIVRNCTMHEGHGGVVLGSEISGGAKNIFAENCKMDSPNLDRAIRIKTNHFRGGNIEDIFVRNIEVGEVKEAVVKMNLRYDIKNEGGTKFYPTLKNVYIQNITASKSKYAFYFDGLPESKISNVFIDNCKFTGMQKDAYINNIENFEATEVYINKKLYRF